MLVLGDHGGHALAGLNDSGRGLGGGAGDGVDVWSAEVVARVGLVGAGRSDWQVVVESSDGAGVVRQHSLGSQEWVEGLQTRVSSSRIIVITITPYRIVKTLRYLNLIKPRLTLLPELVCASEGEVSS